MLKLVLKLWTLFNNVKICTENSLWDFSFRKPFMRCFVYLGECPTPCKWQRHIKLDFEAFQTLLCRVDVATHFDQYLRFGDRFWTYFKWGKVTNCLDVFQLKSFVSCYIGWEKGGSEIFLITRNQKLIISAQTSSTVKVFQLGTVYEQKVQHSNYWFAFTCLPLLDTLVPKKMRKKRNLRKNL